MSWWWRDSASSVKITMIAERMGMKLSWRFLQQLPDREKKLTLSNWLTIARIALTPIIVMGMIKHWWGIACILFAIACITDMLDGNIARLRNEQTLLGACLDPIADKFLILACFFTLAFVQSPLFSIPKWFVLLVLVKELLLIIGAILLYMRNGYIQVRPLLIGKVTTVVQMGFIGWLFACYFFAWMPIKIYYGMLGVLFLLVIGSLVAYSLLGIRWLRHG